MADKTEALQEAAVDFISISRVFDAPRQLVWDAWTTPELCTRWWGPKNFTSPVCRIDLRVGGHYLFCMRSPEGQDFWSTGIYKEVEAPARLVCTDSFSDAQGNLVPASQHGLSGDWPLELLVTLTLEETDGKTTFHLVHEGVPGPEMQEMCKAGWLESLDKLEAILQEVQSNSSPNHNPASDSEFVQTHVLDAPKELVYQVWTQPEHLSQWWGPKGFTIEVAKFELVPGGMFHYSMQAGNGPKMWGKFVYREINAPDQIVFINAFSDKTGATLRAPFSQTWPLEMLNNLTLTEENGQTTLTLKGSPFNATQEECATYVAGFESMRQGFSGTFEQLKAYLAQLQSL